MTKMLPIDFFDSREEREALIKDIRNEPEIKHVNESILLRSGKCPECGATISQTSSGELFCAKCGFVLL